MNKENKAWKEQMSDEDEKFVNQNVGEIDKFLETYTAKHICKKYYANIDASYGELKSELYFALRKIACYCDDRENAFVWYGPVVFRNTTEEYFINNIRKASKETEIAIEHLERLTEPKHFRVFDCPAMISIVKKAVPNIKQRKAFWLRVRYYQGLMTFEHVGKRTGCNKSNAKRHFDRAVKNLQNYVMSIDLGMDEIYRSLSDKEINELF